MSDLVKTVLSVQFAEAFHPWLELRELLRVAGDNPKMEVQGQPLVIDRKSRKQRVILEIRALALQQEGAQSAKEAMDSALSLMSQMQEVVTIPKIAWLRYDGIFIES
ncbi:MAG: hypothetical protein Q8O76_11830, partial [Chloroflexota bacterium]|nr:hypothetical protein [Chloroflexota bacterium]